MTIKITIKYQAEWGQTLCMVGHTESREWTENAPLFLECSGSDYWETSIEIPDIDTLLTYRYGVKTQDGHFFYERGDYRRLNIGGIKGNCRVVDYWRAKSLDDSFMSSLFTDALFSRTKKSRKSVTGNLRFSICLPRIQRNEAVAIVGNIPELGNWDCNNKLILSDKNFPTWEGGVKIKSYPANIEYKYVIFNTETNEIVDMEYGDNRRLWTSAAESCLCINDYTFRYTRGAWRGAGVAIPVFSLRTQDGFGVGEFLDLKKMVDWAVSTNMKMIQTLPINDTTMLWTNKDSYPYSTVSVFALHPLYLRLEKIGKLKDKKQQSEFEAKREELNALDYVNYQEIIAAKWEYIRAVYPAEKEKVFASADYKKWFETNQSWLMPYAAFCYLRDLNKTPEFAKWGEYAVYNENAVAKLCDKKSNVFDDIAIHYFVQYHLHKQLSEVRDYAHLSGVALKGDIPIGINPNSADAWQAPELFDLSLQAGAPPDDFSISGQNWGFPPYNWDIMARDNFDWWRRRFVKMADYFDAYRIDHILGFFRIWVMPQQAVWGLTGCFLPALPYSLDDLRQRGIWIDEKRMLAPYIHQWCLQEMFGHRWEEVRDRFFDIDGYEMFRFKPEFDTEKKVQAYFRDNNLTSEEDIRLRNALYELHCEVLFVRDPRQPELLHPRISMNLSRSFRALNDHDKNLLMDLYNEFFFRRHNEFWKQSAYKKLPTLIASTRMLVCGEDLGMVPDTVPEVMNELQILSLEIQRMPKNPKVEFAHPADAPYLSVCTTGTHDMNPLRAWWEENYDKTQCFYNHTMGWWGGAPAKCSGAIAEAILKQHVYSPAMWVILPLQDWFAIDEAISLPNVHAERINVPENPDHFWCYRMHVTMEDLLQNESFSAQVKALVDVRN